MSIVALRFPGWKRALAAMALIALSAATQAQSFVGTPSQRCQRALVNPVVRLAMPAMSSRPVREAVCDCIRSSTPPAPSAASAVVPDSLLADAARDCIARAAPAERQAALPRESILLLQDAFGSTAASPAYVGARLDFGPCSKPEYPPAAVRAEATGVTGMVLRISDTGQVLDGEVTRSSGTSAAHKLLDATALITLMRCKAVAARWQGQPINGWANVEYVWKLN